MGPTGEGVGMKTHSTAYQHAATSDIIVPWVDGWLGDGVSGWAECVYVYAISTEKLEKLKTFAQANILSRGLRAASIRE